MEKYIHSAQNVLMKWELNWHVMVGMIVRVFCTVIDTGRFTTLMCCWIQHMAILEKQYKNFASPANTDMYYQYNQIEGLTARLSSYCANYDKVLNHTYSKVIPRTIRGAFLSQCLVLTNLVIYQYGYMHLY